MFLLPVLSFSEGLKGSYILFIRLHRALVLSLRSREFTLTQGEYIYVGSAFGSGGLKSRVSRHLLKNKPKHWHVDFLTSSPHSEISGIAFFIDQKVECILGRFFSSFSSFEPIPGFGNSDCTNSCPSHLFRIREKNEER